MIRRDKARLEAYLAPWRTAGMDYSQFDCVRLACGWVKLWTGQDILPELRDWSCKASGLRALSATGQTIKENVDGFLGHSVPVPNARWGDIVAIETRPFDTLGIHDGGTAIFIAQKIGLQRLPLSRCDFAWRIKCRM